jgi:cell division protein ZapA
MSDTRDNQAVSITILDKEYLIACPEEERHDLMRSADYLDRKMREIRDAGKIIGTERIAVMAALNLAHELLTGKSDGVAGSDSIDPAIAQRIRSLQHRIEEALYRSRQLEI